ncbi:MAG TPA: ATP-binding protein [Candidatus Paenibacillus intestinavium]|nr:ATP-binding protein [Candidatus Paenibacillus intestinavium]
MVLTSFNMFFLNNEHEKITFRLVGEYGGSSCVKAASLIFGENGTGKTMLGRAMMDIVSYLTDRHVHRYHLEGFNNFDCSVSFAYTFFLLSCRVEYRYTRVMSGMMMEEELLIDDRVIVSYNHTTHYGFDELKEETVIRNLEGRNMSFLKYIMRNNFHINGRYNEILSRFGSYVEGMSFFEIPEILHADEPTHRKKWTKKIIDQGRVKSFEQFLHNFNVKGIVTETNGRIDEPKISWKINNKQVDFFSMASSSTVTLATLYPIISEIQKYSFLYIDNFDVYLSPLIARQILHEFMGGSTQIVLTTHNTSLIDTALLKPECYFTFTSAGVSAFSSSTSKELREEHNLEKLYRAGHFNNNNIL